MEKAKSPDLVADSVQPSSKKGTMVKVSSRTKRRRRGSEYQRQRAKHGRSPLDSMEHEPVNS